MKKFINLSLLVVLCIFLVIPAVLMSGCVEEKAPKVEENTQNIFIYDSTNIKTTNPANVSKTNGTSWDPSVALDSLGNPHIVWEDCTNGLRAVYIKWDGQNWVCLDGSIYSPMDYMDYANPAYVSARGKYIEKVSIVLDSSDNPHLIWHDRYTKDDTENSGVDVIYIKWNGKNWVCADGSVYDQNNTKKSNPANVSKDKLEPEYSYLALGSSGFPHIVWEYGKHHIDSKYKEIYYIRWNGENWVCADGSNVHNPENLSISNSANVSQNESDSYEVSFALDSSDNPHISWCDGSYDEGYDICYVTLKENKWVCIDGSLYDPLTGNCNISKTLKGSGKPSLAIDSLENPNIAWSDSSFDNQEIIYIKWNGSNWLCADGSIYDSTNQKLSNPANVTNNVNNSSNPFLSLDANDNPHLTRYEFDKDGIELYYTFWDGDDWLCADGSLYQSVGLTEPNRASFYKSKYHYSEYPRIVIDSLNNPHVVWQGSSFGEKGDIVYIKWDGNSWICFE